MSETLKFQQTDGPTAVELNVWHDAPGTPGGFSEETVSPTPAPTPTDGINYESQNPEYGRTFDQTSWVAGFGEGRVHTPSNEQHYGYSDGVLAMFEHQLVPSYREDVVGVIVRNGTFEDTDVAMWTGTNATLAHTTTAADVDVGTGALQITADANNGTASQSFSHSLSPGNGVNVFRSRTIKLVARIRRKSGSGTILLRLTDSAGSTDSSTSNATSYTTLEVERTIDASATSLSFTFLLDTSGDVFTVDEVAIIPAGGTQWNSRPISFKGSHPSSRENMFIAMGRCILVWHEGDSCLYPVFIDSANEVKGLEAFGDTTARLYAAMGDGNNYQVSANGTTWADPINLQSGNADYADKFIRAQDSSRDNTLMKARGTNIAVSTDDPSDASKWGAEIPVGTVDRPITSLLSTNGIAYVGKTDGMYVFDRSNSKMRDIEPDANFFVDSENFTSTLGRGGVVYASGGQSTFWRLWPAEEGAVIHRWLDLSELLQAPAFKGYGGRVVAMAQDRLSIWVLLADDATSDAGEFPYTFPFNFARPKDSAKMRLLALRPPAKDQQDFITDNVLVSHSVTAISSMTTASQMGRFTEDSRSSLFILGRKYDSGLTGTAPNVELPVVVRLRLSPSSDNPALAPVIQMRKTGDFYTSWIDGGFPDVEKALSKIILNTKNCDTNRTITVYYKADDDTDDDSTGWTQFPDSSTVVNTSPAQTLSIDTTDATDQIPHKRIRFKLAFSSNSHTADPPIVTGIVIHTVWNPGDYRRFRAVTKIGDKRFTTSRNRSQLLPAETIVSRLRELQEEPYVTVTTPLGDSYTAWIRFGQDIISKRQHGKVRRTDYTRVITIEGGEVRTT